MGPGTTCETSHCALPLGACCMAADCSCVVDHPWECNGGVWWMDGICDPRPCNFPTGACCLQEADCIVVDQCDCTAQGGTFLAGRSCDPNPCQPTPTKIKNWGAIKYRYR